MRVVDSSRYVTALRCMRERYWAYEHDGTGYNPEALNDDFAFGLAMHNGLEVLHKVAQLETDLFSPGSFAFTEALTEAVVQCTKIQGFTADGYKRTVEYTTLAHGLLYTYSTLGLPSILTQYSIDGVEEEMSMPLTREDQAFQLHWLTRLDVKFKRLSDGLKFNVEVKTTAFPNDLVDIYKYDMQLLMEAATYAYGTGEEIEGTLIIGLNKGSKVKAGKREQERGITGERRSSPYTYLYMNDDGKVHPGYKAGWTRRPTWEVYPNQGELEQYFGTIPIAGQVVIPDMPIYFDREREESMKGQVLALEGRIAQGVTRLQQARATGKLEESALMILDNHFPMNTRYCTNMGGFKKPCPFIKVCHGGEDPSYTMPRRTPNHPAELTLWEHSAESL